MERIIYQDHNNNRYVAIPTRLSYDPIKPEESSSGTYSGGVEKSVELEDFQFNRIMELVEAIAQNKNLHLTQRRMLTSRLYWDDGDSEYHIILGKSTLQKELLDFLKSLL